MELSNHNSELQSYLQAQNNPNVKALASFLAGGNFKRTNGSKDINIVDQAGAVYDIPADSIPRFFELIEQCRREDKKGNLVLHFSEKQMPVSGIVFDFDLYIKTAKFEFGEAEYKDLLLHLDRLIRKYIALPKTHCYHAGLLLRPKTTEVDHATYGKCFKFGFHVIIPGIMISKRLKLYLYDQIIKDNDFVEWLRSTEAINMDSLESIFDKGSLRNPILFIGNRKTKASALVYKLAWAFHVTKTKTGSTQINRAEEFDESKFKAADKLGSLVKEKGRLNATEYQIKAMKEEEQKNRPNLIYEFSINWKCETGIIQKEEFEADIEYKDEIEKWGIRRNDKSDEEELVNIENDIKLSSLNDPNVKEVMGLLDILDVERASDRNSWRDVIYCLAAISREYKPLAYWFSQKCPEKWQEGGEAAVDALWDEAIAAPQGEGEKLSIKSLYYWAKQDNAELYEQWKSKSIFFRMSDMAFKFQGDINHQQIADILHIMLKDKFVASQTTTSTGRAAYKWYEFVLPTDNPVPGQDYKWRHEPEPINMINYISYKLPLLYEDVEKFIESRKDDADDENEIKYYVNVKKKFQKSKKNLGTSGYVNGVMDFTPRLFIDRTFEKLLDQQEDVLGVGNGVLHLDPYSGQVKLLQGYHEYKVMRHTTVAYRPYEKDNIWYKRVVNFFENVFPEPDVREFMSCFFASSLNYKVKDSIFFLWQGIGANGKSTTLEMITNMLGDDFGKKLDLSLITTGRGRAEGPNSAMMQLMFARMTYFSETKEGVTLEMDKIREFTGGEKLSGRDLHEKQKQFLPKTNYLCGFNEDPMVNGTSHGIWRRIYYYAAKTRFMTADKINPANPYEKLADPKYQKMYPRSPEFLSALLFYLCEWFTIFVTKYKSSLMNIHSPTIAAHTLRFRNKNDHVNRFITERLVMAKEGPKFTYTIEEIINHYVEWYRANIKDEKLSKATVREHLMTSSLEKYFDCTGNVPLLKGWRILESGEHIKKEKKDDDDYKSEVSDRIDDHMVPNNIVVDKAYESAEEDAEVSEFDEEEEFEVDEDEDPDASVRK
nr:putative helicase [Kaumoebavirus]